MKKTICAALACLAGAALPSAVALAADVCGEGVGIPPFLSSGAKPNLLMVLDNSGSMLDAAYSKEGDILGSNSQPITIGSGNNAFNLQYQRCMDGDYDIVSGKTTKTTITSVTGYDRTAVYAGYFKNDAWYKWSPGEYEEWASGTLYTQNVSRVYANGNIYQANTTGTSDGTSIDKDGGVQWRHLPVKGIQPALQYWINNRAYPANSFTWSGPQLYYTVKGGTSKDSNTANGLSILEDTGITWVAVEHTWRNELSYDAGDIVSYNGIYYQAINGNNGKQPDKNKGVNWKSLRQGEFQEITAADAVAHCNTTGTKYTRADNLCITIDNTKTPKKVNAFAARGNLLNWAIASKFDVQKKILTGGKHNYHEGVLVAEHRGCSGSRLIKQIQLDNSEYLVLGVRGSKSEFDDQFLRDRLDTTDDTSRLEVLAVSATGFQSSSECQDMLDMMTRRDSSGANWSQKITDCLETFPANDTAITHQRPMLNHSLQFCSTYWKDLADDGILNDNTRSINTIKSECEKLYKGNCATNNQTTCTDWTVPPYPPPSLVPAYGAYICYGIYDSGLPHGDRAGYVGRCWQSAAGVYKTCVAKPAVAKNNQTGEGCNITGQATECPYEYPTGSRQWYKNAKVNGSEYNYKCTILSDNANGCPEWKAVYHWSNGSGECVAGTAAQQGAAGSDGGGQWETVTGNNNYTDNCIIEASEDYCRDTTVPEVIDPSDQAGDTTKVWNIPGVVADSQIIALTGGTQALSTMKGYIKQGARPEGVVHKVASDLRLGVMALRYVGAATECQATYRTAGIERFCPQNNRDGGELMVPLDVGDTVKDENDGDYPSSKRRHVHDLANAVNKVRGTSWTPLAEALYNALGYYTQNGSFCFNFDSNGKCLDFPICETYNSANKCTDTVRKDPVQYWCQDNHILLITEGESTADIQANVVSFASNPTAENQATRFPSKRNGDDLDGDGTAEPAFTPGTSTPCGDKLFRSTYLDDMTWWGQHAGPLYTKRQLLDSEGRANDKQNIYTHVVTTGALTSGGTGECNPVTLMTQAAMKGGAGTAPDYYYHGENPQQLEENLYAVLDDILSRSSAGSAASVISSSRSGSGAVYQAVFWPKHEDGVSPKNKVTWVGDVHSLFVSSDGKMYDDFTGNGKLDLPGDNRIIFYFSNVANRTRGCYVSLNSAGQCPNEPVPAADNLDPKCGTGHSCVEITDIKYIWSANKKLAAMNVMNDRKIYTWNDADNNGIVDSGEFFKLTDLKNQLNALNSKTADADIPRGAVGNDFITPTDWETFAGYTPRGANETEENYKKRREQEALDALVQWLQGVDTPKESETTDANGNGRLDTALRSRAFDLNGNTTLETGETWRLGDIIHSTPIVVAKPAEYYHYIYRDPTYRDFAEKWAGRRNMVYFGGNDGMLHAVNGGFHADSNGSQFCCAPFEADGTCATANQPNFGSCGTGKPALGAEMWAYIPYNLQPHLKCLADKYYAHKYYVDQKPRIFDAQIFKEDEDHPGGWGTILVGALRFGGAPIKASELNGNPNDKRVFTSSFFILDITNPEKEPVLLGEMTQLLDSSGNTTVYADMGYTTSSPAMVIMRDGYPNPSSTGNTKTDWYLIMGNGPTNMSRLDGSNNPAVQGNLAVLPLGWLQGPATNWSNGVISAVGTKKPFRIPKAVPSTGSDEGGIFTLPGSGPSFISDIISVDYNVNLSAADSLGSRYRADAVYFGTVDGTDFTSYPPNYQSGLEEQHYWDKGGRIFRLVTKRLGGTEDTNGNSRLDIGEDVNNNNKLDVGSVERASKPSDWPGMWTNSNPIRLLADVKMPVVGAPSIGYDGQNFWVYAGTGRFYGDKDKTDDGWCLSSSGDCDGDNDRSKVGYFGLKESLKDASLGDYTRDWGWAPSVASAMPNTNGVYRFDPIMTWATIDWDINTQDNSGLQNNLDWSPTRIPTGVIPGKRGLMRTDNIIVADKFKSPYIDENGEKVSYLECYSCKTDVLNRSKYSCTALSEAVCFPGAFQAANKKALYLTVTDTRNNSQLDKATFDLLRTYIAGIEDNYGFMTVDGKDYTTGLDGWYRKFHDLRERNLGAAALLGGLLTYTTYQPFNDKCKAEGESSLYGVHFQTGTAWTDTVFGTFDSDDGDIHQGNESGNFIMDKLSLGRGLSTSPSMHVGTGDQAAKAFIQTSTGEIIEVEQKNLPIKSGKSGRINWTDRCAP